MYEYELRKVLKNCINDQLVLGKRTVNRPRLDTVTYMLLIIQ